MLLLLLDWGGVWIWTTQTSQERKQQSMRLPWGITLPTCLPACLPAYTCLPACLTAYTCLHLRIRLYGPSLKQPYFAPQTHSLNHLLSRGQLTVWIEIQLGGRQIVIQHHTTFFFTYGTPLITGTVSSFFNIFFSALFHTPPHQTPTLETW